VFATTTKNEILVAAAIIIEQQNARWASIREKTTVKQLLLFAIDWRLMYILAKRERCIFSSKLAEKYRPALKLHSFSVNVQSS
jgi:hypothetical protein